MTSANINPVGTRDGVGRPEMTWERISGKAVEAEESNTSESSKLASMAKSD
jgi:hypothetical protein